MVSPFPLSRRCVLVHILGWAPVCRADARRILGTVKIYLKTQLLAAAIVRTVLVPRFGSTERHLDSRPE